MKVNTISDVEKTTGTNKKMTFTVVLACFFLLLAVCGSGALEITAPQVVLGIVDDVRGSSVMVNGRYYDISGVPVFTVRGASLSADLIKRGNGIEIIIENRVITRVTIDPLNLAK